VSGPSEQKPKCTGPSEGDRVPTFGSTYVRDQLNGTKCTGTKYTRPTIHDQVYKNKSSIVRDHVYGTKLKGPSARDQVYGTNR
jgi:hypothetical protein